MNLRALTALAYGDLRRDTEPPSDLQDDDTLVSERGPEIEAARGYAWRPAPGGGVEICAPARGA